MNSENKGTGLQDEERLFQLIAGGNETAFRQLFDGYRLRLFNFALELTHSRTDAEEMVQEVFLKLWKGRSNLSAVISPQKYIYTMLRNQVLDHLTRMARDKKLRDQAWANIQAEGDYTEQAILAAETDGIVRKALQQLSPRKQTIYQLSRHEGLSHQEIASQLGISVPTVKNTMVEILRFIKTYLRLQYGLLLLAGIASVAAFFRFFSF